MGLFDFLSKKSSEGNTPAKKSQREMARLSRLVGDKMAQNYDRQEAIETLSSMGTAEAAEALLRRFTFSMEPSITDQEEKESAAEGIVSAGETALGPIRSFCLKAESMTWPLRVLRRIVPEEQIVDELLSILDQFDTEYVRNPEPKGQLIGVLEEHACDEVREAVEPFMTDVSEPVRFQAVTTVFAAEDERSVPSLVAALEEEESLRIKNRIARGIADRGWTIPEELRDTCKAALPEGFRLEGGHLKAVA